MDTFSELLNGSTLTDFIGDENNLIEFIENSINFSNSDEFEISLRNTVHKVRAFSLKHSHESIDESSFEERKQILKPKIAKIEPSQDCLPVQTISDLVKKNQSLEKVLDEEKILFERLKLANGLAQNFFSLNGCEYIWTELLKIGQNPKRILNFEELSKVLKRSQTLSQAEQYEFFMLVAKFGVNKAMKMSIFVKPEVEVCRIVNQSPLIGDPKHCDVTTQTTEIELNYL